MIMLWCVYYSVVLQIGELLSQDVLLTSEGSGQNSFSNITGNIREVSSRCVSVEREGGRGRGMRER